jgi:hypothetical protein
MGADSDDVDSVLRPIGDDDADLGGSDVESNDEFFSP